ncbi:unnamed protein product [Pylaiella littoralis]
MFLAAVARPRYDSSRNRQFDGKIGIYPFTVQRPAQRNGRKQGGRWAKFQAAHIVFAQQDNAPGHRVMADPDVMTAAGGGEDRAHQPTSKQPGDQHPRPGVLQLYPVPIRLHYPHQD